MTNPLALVGLVIILGIIPTFIGIFFRVLNNRNNVTKSALNNIRFFVHNKEKQQKKEREFNYSRKNKLSCSISIKKKYVI